MIEKVNVVFFRINVGFLLWKLLSQLNVKGGGSHFAVCQTVFQHQSLSQVMMVCLQSS
jgi:hypothetical protein